jgi:RNA ligase
MNILETLNEYHSRGLLYKQVHPTLPLTIWNYTPEVQYSGNWDDITIMCRGLVTDELGNIVARPFKKFWNLEENRHVATSEFEVFAKMDGSLGILFCYNDEWIFATRGSFTSEQSVKGFEMLKEKVDISTTFDKEYTYLFEIIYKQNKIVVRYQFEDVVLLSKIHTVSGVEVSFKDIQSYSKNLLVVTRYDGIKDISSLKSIIKDDEEGFVILFSNGQRIKIKGEEYLRLHKVMTNLSTTAIWEVLASGGSTDALLVDVPDEFYNKIKEYEANLRYKYGQIKGLAGVYFDNYYEGYDGILPDRATYAHWVLTKDRALQPILFKMYDGNTDYSSYIWKLIKPKFEKL